MLGNAWYWKDASTDTQTVTLTLKDLTVGHRYLVQILSHNTWTSGMRISAGGCEPQPVHGSDAAGGKYGALLTGVFTALATTEDVAAAPSSSVPSTMPERETVAFEPLTAAVAAPIDGATTGGGVVPIVKETDFSADVLFLSVVIETAHVYSPSARFPMSKDAVAPDWFWSAVTAAAPLSE